MKKKNFGKWLKDNSGEPENKKPRWINPEGRQGGFKKKSQSPYEKRQQIPGERRNFTPKKFEDDLSKLKKRMNGGRTSGPAPRPGGPKGNETQPPPKDTNK